MAHYQPQERGRPPPRCSAPSAFLAIGSGGSALVDWRVQVAFATVRVKIPLVLLRRLNSCWAP